VELGKSLAKIPTKVATRAFHRRRAHAIRRRRSASSGRSIIGGDAFEHGYFMAFWFFLAQLNFVLGAINLVPLLPFDAATSRLRCSRDPQYDSEGACMVAAAPVNYLKLMPATYVILVW